MVILFLTIKILGIFNFLAVFHSENTAKKYKKMHWSKTLALVIFFERVFWVILHQVHSHLFTMFKTLSKVWHPLLVDITALSCMKAYLKTTNKFRRPILEFDFFFHQRGKFSLRHPKRRLRSFEVEIIDFWESG
jgi:hypothetical protein